MVFRCGFVESVESSLTSRLTWFARKQQQQQNFINKQIKFQKCCPQLESLGNFRNHSEISEFFHTWRAIASKAIRGGTMRAKYKKQRRS